MEALLFTQEMFMKVISYKIIFSHCNLISDKILLEIENTVVAKGIKQEAQEMAKVKRDILKWQLQQVL